MTTTSSMPALPAAPWAAFERIEIVPADAGFNFVTEPLEVTLLRLGVS